MLRLLLLLSTGATVVGESVAVGSVGEQKRVKRTPLYQPMSIVGQTVLITGATAGIGEACAWRFAEAGANVVLVGRRAQRLTALKAALEEAYPDMRAQTLTLDVQDLEAISSLPAVLPAVDILVNNAGLALGVNSVSLSLIHI